MGGLSLLQARQYCSAGSFVLQGLTMLFISQLPDPKPHIVTACLVLNAMLTVIHANGFQAAYLDVSQKNAGFLCGVGNTCASIPGYVGPVFASWVLKTYDSW